MKKIITLLKKIKKIIHIFLKTSFYHFCKLLPIKRNWIIADNFNGNKIGDNPGAIVEKIIKANDKVVVFWTLNDNNIDCELPSNINKVRFYSFKHIYVLARAKVWIDNVRNPLIIKKRKKQLYIQTWHGGLGLKRIEKDVENLLTKEYVKSAKNDSKNIDLLLTNCKWQEEYFRKYFWYDGKILCEGLPRNDILINTDCHESIKKQFYKQYNIDSNTKLLLYAPTFRNGGSIEAYNIDFSRLIDNLEKKYSCKWIVLFRLHPNINSTDLSCINDDRIINVSKYPNLNDLLISSDIVISDYSSLVFEFSFLYKPVIIYASDMKEYVKERGFCIEFSELPYPIATNNDELSEIVLNYKYDKTFMQDFFKKYGLNETGTSSEKVVNIILDFINK